MEQTTKLFSQSMGRWLMALMLVMLSPLATRAAEVYVRMGDAQGVPGETVLVPIYVDCDVDMRAFEMYFSTDLGVCFSEGEFSDRVDPSSYNGFSTSSGIIMAAGLTGYNDVTLEAGDGLVAELSVDIPDDAQPGAHTMTLSGIQFIPAGSGAGSSIYLDDVTATLTVIGGDPEAYACYTPGNTTLTFYYDKLRSSRPGTTYDINTGTNAPRWFIDGTYANVTKVVFDPSFANARPTTTYEWFFQMAKLTSITGLNYLNTSEVTNMQNMFLNCNVLTSLDLSNFNTANVTKMSNMFSLCSALTSLDLSSFNTSNVTTMESMFSGCSGLTSLDVSGFNTANVTAMGFMFYNCSSLTSVDLSSFNTTNVTTMQYMFYTCSSLTSVDLSSFNTANVTTMERMFYNCTNLTTIYAGDGWSTAAVTQSRDMFSGCRALEGGMGTTYSSSNPMDKTYARIDGGESNPGYFTDKSIEAYACYTPGNTTLTFYRDKLRATRSGTTYDLNTGNNTPEWYNDLYSNSTYSLPVTRVVFDPSFADALPKSTYRWFNYMKKLESITGLSYLNTARVTNMQDMFYYCSNLTSIDVSGFDTENVTTMQGMFYLCSKITTLDVSGFNTENVTDMGGMFYSCDALTSIDVSGFNTDMVTDMGSMFSACVSLTSLDVTSFNTPRVTNMEGMFSSCSRLTSLDLSSFNTAKVTDMEIMFADCFVLTSLDLSSFNTAKVTDMTMMFSECNNLVTIYVSDAWSTEAVTNSFNMFYGCSNLVGGMGTTYDFYLTNADYAHIDGGPSNPGYFTEKPAFVRGDVNGDGRVSINDVTALINYLLSHDPTGINLQGADSTMNEVININDVTFLINYLLSGSW